MSDVVKAGGVMVSSKEIADWLNTKNKNVLRDIRRMFPCIDSKKVLLGYNNMVQEIYLIKEETVLLLRSKRNLTAIAREKLAELTGILENSASAEGIFGDLLESAMVGFNIALSKQLTLERQVSDGDYVFDFYIPELKLYIEYNEQGEHHNKTKDSRKASAVNQKVFTVDYTKTHKENVEITLIFMRGEIK